MRFVLLLILLSYLGARAQNDSTSDRVTPAAVPADVAAVVSVSYTPQGAPVVTIKNTGQRPITGFVIRKITKPEQIMSQDTPDGPLMPGGTRATIGINTPEWANLTPTDLQVDAVLFADGTWLGDARDPNNPRISEVREIFGARQAQADELQKWGALVQHLPSNDSDALKVFLSASDSAQEKGYGSDSADGRREIVIQDIKATADRIRKMQASGSYSASQIRHQMLDSFASRADRAAANALDAGRASK